METYFLKTKEFDKALKDKLLSQNEFCGIAGLTVQTICRAKRSQTVRMSTVRKILTALEKRDSIDEFFIPVKE